MRQPSPVKRAPLAERARAKLARHGARAACFDARCARRTRTCRLPAPLRAACAFSPTLTTRSLLCRTIKWKDQDDAQILCVEWTVKV
jgi:hypothetical protein